jgi:hypothetical protein
VWIQLTCSRCGTHRRISDNHPEHAVKAAKAGWRSFGAVIYCPDCSKTWHKRNTKRLGSELDTIERILVIMRCCKKKEVEQ